MVRGHGVDYLFDLARHVRLQAEIAAELAESAASGQAARRFKDLLWMTRDSWSRRRRVVGPFGRLGVRGRHTPRAPIRAL
jgi:hypothetical protein